MIIMTMIYPLSELKEYIDLYCTFAVSSKNKNNKMFVHVPVNQVGLYGTFF